MKGVGPEHLAGLYDATDDPWSFRSDPYEIGRFAATVAALPRRRYASALEVGCGNGELARRVAPRCGAYAGLDAVEEALISARRAVPEGRFVQGFLPCPLPDGPGDAAHDLVLLSEVLYFLDPGGLDALSRQIDRRWPDADVVCVTWRGPSGNPLGGEEAFCLFRAATARGHRHLHLERRFRIDLLEPLPASDGSASG
jgi:SAM-dependent methyltransferase